MILLGENERCCGLWSRLVQMDNAAHFTAVLVQALHDTCIKVDTLSHLELSQTVYRTDLLAIMVTRAKAEILELVKEVEEKVASWARANPNVAQVYCFVNGRTDKELKLLLWRVLTHKKLTASLRVRCTVMQKLVAVLHSTVHGYTGSALQKAVKRGRLDILEAMVRTQGDVLSQEVLDRAVAEIPNQPSVQYSMKFELQVRAQKDAIHIDE